MNIITKINWKIRVKNPVFWVNIGISIIVPILTYMGLSWNDMTTWATLFNTLLAAVKNPVVVVAVLVSVWNAIIDPTTTGVSDSKLAMSYDKPKGDE